MVSSPYLLGTLCGSRFKLLSQDYASGGLKCFIEERFFLGLVCYEQQTQIVLERDARKSRSKVNCNLGDPKPEVRAVLSATPSLGAADSRPFIS
jgi:hypothetical protein